MLKDAKFAPPSIIPADSCCSLRVEKKIFDTKVLFIERPVRVAVMLKADWLRG